MEVEASQGADRGEEAAEVAGGDVAVDVPEGDAPARVRLPDRVARPPAAASPGQMMAATVERAITAERIMADLGSPTLFESIPRTFLKAAPRFNPLLPRSSFGDDLADAAEVTNGSHTEGRPSRHKGANIP